MGRGLWYSRSKIGIVSLDLMIKRCGVCQKYLNIQVGSISHDSLCTVLLAEPTKVT
jgi:hypothetical protein